MKVYWQNVVPVRLNGVRFSHYILMKSLHNMQMWIIHENCAMYKRGYKWVLYGL